MIGQSVLVVYCAKFRNKLGVVPHGAMRCINAV